jgi:hypothetical protein
MSHLVCPARVLHQPNQEHDSLSEVLAHGRSGHSSHRLVPAQLLPSFDPSNTCLCSCLRRYPAYTPQATTKSTPATHGEANITSSGLGVTAANHVAAASAHPYWLLSPHRCQNAHRVGGAMAYYVLVSTPT